MRIILLITLLVINCHFTQQKTLWHQLENYSYEQYVEEFGKTRSQENKQIFEQNMQNIKTHNALNKSWKMGVNQFTDQDVVNKGFDKTLQGAFQKKNDFIQFMNSLTIEKKQVVGDYPKSVDWRTKGVVTPVKNQGHCGSCWAFAATEMIESYVAIETNELLQLAAQQLVSCSSNPFKCGGTGGCNGSVGELAFNYVQLYGQTTENFMPYISGVDGLNHNCTYDRLKTPPMAHIDGYWRLKTNSEEDIMNHLASTGPLLINIDASNWHSYESGVYDGCDYSKNIDVDHVVQLVGYDSDETGAWWIVRNHWTNSWGEEGYMRLKRNPGAEQCGTDSTVQTGTACEGDGQTTQRVCGACGIFASVLYPVGARLAN